MKKHQSAIRNPQSAFSRGFLTLSLVTLCVTTLTVVASAVIVAGYGWAVSRLKEAHLESTGGLSGGVVYAQPTWLMANQQLSPAEVADRVRASGYEVVRVAESEMTFTTPSGEAVTVYFRRWPSSDRYRLTHILTSQGETDRLALDPPTLMSYVNLYRGSGQTPTVMLVRRQPLQLSEIVASPLRDAIPAAEDRYFDQHGGLNYVAILKGIWHHRGGSTITNQTVKNLILRDQRKTYGRKLQEAFVSLALEARYTKDEILTFYCNNVYLGDWGGVNLYGFGAASQAFFGKQHPTDLTLAEAALLAAWLNRPADYARDARQGQFERIRQRRDHVLDAMGQLSPEKYPAEVMAQAKASPVTLLAPTDRRQLDIEPRYFLDYATSVLPVDFHEEGFQFNTTLDADLQRAAEQAVSDQLAQWDQRGLPLNAVVVVLDAETGWVLALVGGRDYARSQFNCATSARRSPGSAIKPFFYLKAIESGQHNGQPFTAATWLDPADLPRSLKQLKRLGMPARTRRALAASYNGGPMLAARSVGLKNMRRFLETITDSSPAVSELMAIGGVAGSETSLMNLASAYTIFANAGVQATPVAVISAHQRGRPVTLPGPPPRRVVEAAPAWIVANMLSSVVGDGPDGRFGTAGSARALVGLDDAVFLFGKTGTGERADLLMLGGTPRIIVAVWVGDDENRQLKMSDGYSAANVALPIWAAILKAVAKYRPDYLAGPMPAPANVFPATIDPASGGASAEGITEYFIVGRGPRPCHRKSEARNPKQGKMISWQHD